MHFLSSCSFKKPVGIITRGLEKREGEREKGRGKGSAIIDGGKRGSRTRDE